MVDTVNDDVVENGKIDGKDESEMITDASNDSSQDNRLAHDAPNNVKVRGRKSLNKIVTKSSRVVKRDLEDLLIYFVYYCIEVVPLWSTAQLVLWSFHSSLALAWLVSHWNFT